MNQEQHHQPINEVQNLYFELLKRVNYNCLDGECVARNLLEWRHLWYSVIAERLLYLSGQKDTLPIDISLLKAARWNDWPVDILYIWTNEENLPKLRRLIEEHWEADEIGMLTPEDEEMRMANLSDPDNRVLYVWWD